MAQKPKGRARPVAKAKPKIVREIDKAVDPLTGKTIEPDAEPVTETFTVRATAQGYWDHRLREIGAVFDMDLEPTQKLPTWVEIVDDGTEPVATANMHGTGAPMSAEPTPQRAAEGGLTPAEARDPGDEQGNRTAKPGR